MEQLGKYFFEFLRNNAWGTYKRFPLSVGRAWFWEVPLRMAGEFAKGSRY